MSGVRRIVVVLTAAAGALSIAVAMATAGCGGSDDIGPDGTQERVLTDLPVGTFVSTSDVQEDGSAFSTPVTVKVEAKTIRWTAACNEAGGDLDLTPDRLMVDGASQTAVDCPPHATGQDQDLASFFESDPHWKLDGNRLTLSNDDVEVALQREASPAS